MDLKDLQEFLIKMCFKHGETEKAQSTQRHEM
jgi:hypothetical protein